MSKYRISKLWSDVSAALYNDTRLRRAELDSMRAALAGGHYAASRTYLTPEGEVKIEPITHDEFYRRLDRDNR